MLFFNILVQNVRATIFVLISGVIVGIIPTFAIGSNGFGLGVLYRQAAEVSGYSKAALKVLPYGVFEIPALLIAALIFRFPRWLPTHRLHDTLRASPFHQR